MTNTTGAKKILIFGDSHVAALKAGLDNIEAKGLIPKHIRISVRPLGVGGFLSTRFFEEKNGEIFFLNEQYRNNISKLPVDEETTLYGFSGNLHTTRVLRNIDWLNYAPFPLRLEEAPISSALLIKIFEDDQKYLLDFVDSLSRTGKKMFVVEAPHPFRHHRFFSAVRNEVISYIDTQYRLYVKKELNKRNIPFLLIPSECLDHEGFMLDRYRHTKKPDGHHANDEYGTIMMYKILQNINLLTQSTYSNN